MLVTDIFSRTVWELEFNSLQPPIGVSIRDILTCTWEVEVAEEGEKRDGEEAAI